MTGDFACRFPPLARSDRAMLEQVLMRHCIRADVSLSSFDASEAAAAMLALYERGIRDERRLGATLRKIAKATQEQTGRGLR